MTTSKIHKVIIAETAPIILSGFVSCVKQLKDLHTGVIEVDSKESLMETLATEYIDLLLVNPTFGGLMNPAEIRKRSMNPDLKIIAIEIGKLNRATLSLFDDHIHVTDDIQEINNKIKGVIGSRVGEIEEKESLSTREKEIISYVVKGLTNQEIAEKLFLSVHTVMTHRRNIARKLQIHSATGLTIYAIVNKIVDLSEIKL